MEKEPQWRIEAERFKQEKSENKDFNKMPSEKPKEFNPPSHEGICKFLWEHRGLMDIIVPTMTPQELKAYARYSERFIGDSFKSERELKNEKKNIPHTS